jgi:hypothetical protein
MNLQRILLLAICISFGLTSSWAFDKTAFYQTYTRGKAADVTKLLEKLSAENNGGNLNAYVGALTIKKATQAKGMVQKLALFRDGYSSLETAIGSEPANAEYRFLRLTIQEHAPAILKYNQNIAEDKKLILSSYRRFPALIQQQLRQYSRISKVLKVSELK